MKSHHYCYLCVITISGSSSFESQKMDRPSISVTSPMSPGMLRDVPQYLSGQLSVCNHYINFSFLEYQVVLLVYDNSFCKPTPS